MPVICKHNDTIDWLIWQIVRLFGSCFCNSKPGHSPRGYAVRILVIRLRWAGAEVRCVRPVWPWWSSEWCHYMGVRRVAFLDPCVWFCFSKLLNAKIFLISLWRRVSMKEFDHWVWYSGWVKIYHTNTRNKRTNKQTNKSQRASLGFSSHSFLYSYSVNKPRQMT